MMGRDEDGLMGGCPWLPDAAVVLSVYSEVTPPVTPVVVMMVPETAVITIVENNLVPGVRCRWQRSAWTDGPGHVRKIGRADRQRAQRVCMSACKGGGDEAEMKK
jgi:hypothetical protein